jgi:hypothetical protein
MATCEYIISTVLAGLIVVNTIIYNEDEKDHIHPDTYLTTRYEYKNYTAVVSGTLINDNVPLPDYIVDLGASPLNNTEHIWGITHL